MSIQRLKKLKGINLSPQNLDSELNRSIFGSLLPPTAQLRVSPLEAIDLNPTRRLSRQSTSDQAAASSPSNQIYMFGGAADGSKSILGTYNVESQTESTGSTELPQFRLGAAYAILKGRLLMLGGKAGDADVDSVDVFDLKSTRRVQGPRLSEPRTNAACAASKNEILLAGGTNGEVPLNSCEVYNAAKDNFAIVWLRDGRVFAIGGFYGKSRAKTNMTASVEVYDRAWEPASDPTRPYSKWRQVAPMTIPRGCHAAVCVEGRILVAGGAFGEQGAKTGLDAVELYEPPSEACPMGQWTRIAAMKQKTALRSAVFLAGAIYAFGKHWNT
ncbi:unnamed protein product [Schistocephalus solidus]|uniref:Kelch repeat-containing protein n=1 Tax=Schistocephalus solidus TaxID=70667 RepID=A0A183SIP3_SCHSO|nr:unnamed protein product [Schistocephalus solidus]